MAKCRSCHAEIIWARTSAGKKMPLDAKTLLGFRIVARETPGELECVTQQIHLSHFATCPNANQHRSSTDE